MLLKIFNSFNRTFMELKQGDYTKVYDVVSVLIVPLWN